MAVLEVKQRNDNNAEATRNLRAPDLERCRFNGALRGTADRL